MQKDGALEDAPSILCHCAVGLSPMKAAASSECKLLRRQSKQGRLRIENEQVPLVWGRILDARGDRKRFPGR